MTNYALPDRSGPSEAFLVGAVPESVSLPTKPSLLAASDRPDLLGEILPLAGEHFEVTTANGAAAALQTLAAGAFDVLLADQSMNPLTGLQLLSWAHRAAPRMVGLLLAERDQADLASEAIRRGQVYDCAPVPLHAEGLLPVLAGAATPCGSVA